MTLQEAQATFRQSPGRVTALAYMDAAIEEWNDGPLQTTTAVALINGCMLRDRMQEIRDWLMNEKPPWPPSDDERT